jgi:diguanylate cyclase (GGDEF)-like protein
MLERGTAEAADNTTRLVATVHELMQQAANQGREINLLMCQQDQTEEAAARDTLTGAFNRGGFTARAGDLLGKALRYGSSFAVAYLDVDNFKEINDTCGHAVGDRALQRLVEVLQQVLRQSDLVGRVGGDEFVVLLRDCSQADAVSVIERAIAAIASQRIVAGGLKPTISGGLVWGQIRGPSEGMALEQLMAAADELMYEAKRAGGNRLKWRAVPDAGGSAKHVA